MTINKVLTEIANSLHPVAKVMYKGTDNKCLVIGFKKRMKLKDHSAPIPSKLLVISGVVNYIEGKNVKQLTQFDETEIKVHTLHSVEALEDSLCLLIQG